MARFQGRKSEQDKWDDFVKRVKDLAVRGGKEQHAIALGVALKLRAGPIRQQYKTGIGPDGPWPRRKDGKPALLSNKLPHAVRFQYTETGFKFVWRPPWMAAQHEGHVWPARKQAAREGYQNTKGRFLSAKAFAGRQYQAKKKMQHLQALLLVAPPRRRKALTRQLNAAAISSGYVVQVRGHSIGVRMLPPRKQYPTGGTLPPAWRDAAVAGMRTGMREWRKSLKLRG